MVVKIIDGHCDVLSKMLMEEGIDFNDSTKLDVTYDRLKQAGVAIQNFAIYLPESLKQPQFDHILQCIDLFQRKIIKQYDLRFIRTKHDLEEVITGTHMGGILSLEGCDALAGHNHYLRVLFYLGVRSIGLTWNYGNWAADGVKEHRRGGLTYKGREFVEECNKLGIILDVSHLSETAFWELIELSTQSIMASHSNAQAMCPHPRNLSDEQIIALIQSGGRIGLTFVPFFTSNEKKVRILDLLKHIDHIASLGGGSSIGLGSDFDGIEEYIMGLEHPGQYDLLVNELNKQYSSSFVEGLLFGNLREYYRIHLPEKII